jgi:hypothetical protein
LQRTTHCQNPMNGWLPSRSVFNGKKYPSMDGRKEGKALFYVLSAVTLELTIKRPYCIFGGPSSITMATSQQLVKRRQSCPPCARRRAEFEPLQDGTNLLFAAIQGHEATLDARIRSTAGQRPNPTCSGRDGGAEPSSTATFFSSTTRALTDRCPALRRPEGVDRFREGDYRRQGRPNRTAHSFLILPAAVIRRNSLRKTARLQQQPDGGYRGDEGIGGNESSSSPPSPAEDAAAVMVLRALVGGVWPNGVVPSRIRRDRELPLHLACCPLQKDRCAVEGSEGPPPDAARAMSA